ncbi:MAG: twin-arginine translocase TatA/TatE family subunit [Longimonas sp.]|uniref:Sec-independent protein translocase subunit TatA/TatB n=1 Tax=Longimonas sp. TaxID=2039626 RepID=UPI00334558F1
MGSFGPFEIILIFLVVLLIFGAKRIPEIARGLGRGIREFKDATSEFSRELDMEERRDRIDAPRRPSQGQPQPREQAPAESSKNQSTDPAAEQKSSESAS